MGLYWKSRVSGEKFGVSKENFGVSKKKFGVSKEKSRVFNENLGLVSNENLGFKMCGKSGVSNENLRVSNINGNFLFLNF